MIISTESIKLFRKKFAEAVAGLEKEFDLTISLGNATYTDVDFKTRLTCEKNDKGQSTGTMTEEQKFAIFCEDFGFKPTDYRRQVKIRNFAYEFIAIDPSRPKNCCVLLRVENNTEYNAPATLVKSSFR